MLADWSKPGAKYAEMAIEYGKARGLKGSGHPVISKREFGKQWREWYAYYGWRKLTAIQELMVVAETKTVPSISPYEFDPDFPENDFWPEVPPRFTPAPIVTTEDRIRHAKRYPGIGQNAAYLRSHGIEVEGPKEEPKPDKRPRQRGGGDLGPWESLGDAAGKVTARL